MYFCTTYCGSGRYIIYIHIVSSTCLLCYFLTYMFFIIELDNRGVFIVLHEHSICSNVYELLMVLQLTIVKLIAIKQGISASVISQQFFTDVNLFQRSHLNDIVLLEMLW